jgi:predicted small integral membrane protein
MSVSLFFFSISTIILTVWFILRYSYTPYTGCLIFLLTRADNVYIITKNEKILTYKSEKRVIIVTIFSLIFIF